MIKLLTNYNKVKGLEATFGVKCDFEFSKDYPALYNDPDFTNYVAETIKS